MERAPLNEKALVRAASVVYGRSLDRSQIEVIAESYGRWQGY
jgi:hypothetical protein